MIVLVIAVVVFGGRGKISELMGDFAKGIKSFKKGMTDEETPPKTLAPEPKDVRQAKPEETRSK
jgi:sec-independent protein translocase protein TatA